MQPLNKFVRLADDNDAATVSRRSVAKGLAFGAIAGLLPESASAALNPLQSGAAATQVIRTRWIEIYPGVWRARVGTPESFTPTSSRGTIPLEAALRALAAGEPSVAVPEASFDRTGTTIRLPMEAGEAFYGLGLQMLSFNQRGKKKVLRVNADPQFDSGDSHAPVPFYISSRGYGIFVDTARYATFCFGNARKREEATVEQRVGYAEDAPRLRDEERGYVTVRVDKAPGLDVYLFAGPKMLDAVRRYNLFSGGGVAPPEWGLGFWYRTQAKATDEEVVALAREFRERHIPCDVMGLEPGWQTHAYSCSFLWGAGFPDPKRFVERMTEMQYKVNLWEHAFVHPTAPFHATIAPYSGDYLVWRGLVPDFQGKEARRIFGEHHRKTFLDIGISGFKLDECDNSDYTGGWSFPEFSHFPSGQDGEQTHTTFGLRYQQTLMEQFQARNQPTYGLVRSSGALAAPYPFVLYSDLYDHRSFVRSLVNSGFSGLLWCPEVRDAKGPGDLIRRLQTAVFSPLAMINGWYIANPPWKQQDRKKNNDNKLTPGWEKLEARCREILEWRMMLIPYLRAAFERYAADGTPPIRALVMDYTDDPALRGCDDQFMVGDRMIVAPLFDGEASRKVVLPMGEWCDFWTGEVITGGRAIEVPASFEKIPVYVKAGSVFPMGGIAANTAAVETRRLTVRIFTDGSLPFSMGSEANAELSLSWTGGKGGIAQRKVERPYSVVAWKPATEKFI